MISRYLISKRSDNDINPDNLLSLYLNKIDLWDLDIINENELFEMEINNIKKNMPRVKVSQTFKMSEFLDPENVRLNEIKQMIEKDKEDKEKQKENVRKKAKKKY